jgi:hypothetical protein
MPTGMFLPFFRSATSRVLRSIAGQHPNGADAQDSLCDHEAMARGSFGVLAR